MQKIKLKIKPNQVFGRYTSTGETWSRRNKNGRCVRVAFCKCVCGNERWVHVQGLLQGNSKSCGCLKSDIMRKRKYVHGMSHTSFNYVYFAMMDRCNNIDNPDYHLYGGRGIKCKWKRFIDFKEDMFESYINHKKDNLTTTLERIDNNGNYCKKNCRWATQKEQANNRRPRSK